MKHIALLLLVFCIACGNSHDVIPPNISDTAAAPPDGTVSAGDTADDKGFGRFMIHYNQLISAIRNNDTRAFNNFIHPDLGLCIIEQNGAMPQMRNGKDISRFKTIAGKTIFEMEKQDFLCELKEEALPVVDCETDALWSKTGCFTEAVNHFSDDKIWEHCNLKKEEQEIAAKSAATISRTVINTKGYRFYFSEIEGKWYLTFLDLRAPCSA
jgi:hypothetical protein